MEIARAPSCDEVNKLLDGRESDYDPRFVRQDMRKLITIVACVAHAPHPPGNLAVWECAPANTTVAARAEEEEEESQ